MPFKMLLIERLTSKKCSHIHMQIAAHVSVDGSNKKTKQLVSCQPIDLLSVITIKVECEAKSASGNEMKAKERDMQKRAKYNWRCS